MILNTVDFRGTILKCVRYENNIYVNIEDLFSGLFLSADDLKYFRQRCDSAEFHANTVLYFGKDYVCRNYLRELLMFVTYFIPLNETNLEWVDIYKELPDFLAKHFDLPVGGVNEAEIVEIPGYMHDHSEEDLSAEDETTDTLSDANSIADTNGLNEHDINVPITREEIAAFMLYENQHIEMLERMQTEFMKNQNELMQTFMKTQAEILQHFSSVAINAINTFAFSSTNNDKIIYANQELEISGKQENVPEQLSISWQQMIAEKIQKCHEEYNYSVNTMKSRISAKMKDAGYSMQDLRNLMVRESDNKRCTALDYIEKHENLKELYEKFLDEIIVERKQLRESLNPRKVPEIILQKIDPLVFEGENSKMVLHEIYREMDTRLKTPLNQLKKKFSSQYGYYGCSTAFMIANTPLLLDLFDKVVKESL